MNKFEVSSLKKEMGEKKVKELLGIAKELQIVGRHEMKKADLIDAIVNIKSSVEIAEPEIENADVEDEIKAIAKAEWDVKETPSIIDAVANDNNKKDYIDNVKIDTLIAFKINETKVLSGKIIEIHKDQFVVETKTKIKFNVKKKNVIWVKTGERWPKGVYLALKGGHLNEYKASGERG